MGSTMMMPGGVPRTPGAIALPFLLVLATPAAAEGQAVTPLDFVAFMSGTWCSSPDSRGTIIEEHYTRPSANIMLGVSRFLRDGVTVSYEFSRIEAGDEGVVLTAMPSGQTPTLFPLRDASPDRVVFENLDHDFPVRVIYRRSDTGLVARIEGRDGDGPEWVMAPCLGGDAHD
jgi:hypothetical protein